MFSLRETSFGEDVVFPGRPPLEVHSSPTEVFPRENFTWRDSVTLVARQVRFSLGKTSLGELANIVDWLANIVGEVANISPSEVFPKENITWWACSVH